MRAEQLLKDDEQGVKNTNGEFIRKGTLYTMLVNAQQYEQLIQSEELNNLPALLEDIKINVKDVGKTGLFSFFHVNEWLQNPSHEGRIVTAVLYCQTHPQVIDPQVRQQLQQLESMVSLSTLEQIRNALKAAL